MLVLNVCVIYAQGKAYASIKNKADAEEVLIPINSRIDKAYDSLFALGLAMKRAKDASLLGVTFNLDNAEAVDMYSGTAKVKEAHAKLLSRIYEYALNDAYHVYYYNEREKR